MIERIAGDGRWMCRDYTIRLAGDDDLETMVTEQHAYACELLRMPLSPLYVAEGIRNAQSDGFSVAYNPRWFRTMLAPCPDAACRETIVLGIMAHELGHLYDADRSDNRFVREEYADMVAGMVLAYAGRPLAPMMGLIDRLPPSPNHPIKPVRRRRVRQGYVYGLTQLAAGR